MFNSLYVLVVLSLGVVCTHEFGHWFLAQLCGLRTEEFSIGFGAPRLYLGRFRQTDFYISLWLLGGYVRIPELYSGTNEAFTGLRPPLIDSLVPGFPAASAGLLPEDLVQSVNGLPVNTTTEVAQAVSKHPNEPVQLIVQRRGSDVQIMVTPNAQGRIGAMFVLVREHVSLLTAAYDSLTWTGNILPLPVLDGGHVVLLLLEKIRGKQLGRSAQTAWTSMGVALLVSIMAISTRQDIMHPLW